MKLLKFCLIAVLLSIAGNLQADLNDKLVAYYPFNGNTNDASGNSNDGVINGGVTLTTDRFGFAESAYSFNGIDGYIEISDSDSLDLTSNFTLSAWIKMEGVNTNNINMIINKDNAPEDTTKGSYAYELGVNVNLDFCFAIGGDLSTGWKCGGGPISQSTWLHVLLTYDGTSIVSYIDGESKQTYSGTGSYIINNQPLRIGTRGFHNGHSFWDGKIDDIRIYKRVLSENEIQHLYNRENLSNEVFGRVTTSSEILGYTACVGEATVMALPYNLTAFTDINGDFQITNIPAGKCILLIESSYFQSITKSIIVKSGKNYIGLIEVYNPICQNLCNQDEFDRLSNEYKLISDTYLTLSSNYQTLSSSNIQCKKSIENFTFEIETLKRKMSSMFTQEEMNQALSQKDRIISQLNSEMASMISQSDLDNAIIEARKGLYTTENVELMINKILEWDTNNDGKIGLVEAIQSLMISSGVKPFE